MSKFLNVNMQSWINHKANEKPYIDVAMPAVLESAFNVLVDAFGKLPDASIEVSWWEKKKPRTFFDCRPYQIRLTAEKRRWSKYIYQFSHELCHVMTNFDRNKEHQHNWFEESLCEMASFFVLYRLSETWKNNPPENVIDAVEFAPNHVKYCEDTANQYITPDRKDLPKWLASNISDMEADCYLRCRNAVVALALLDHFQSDPSLWKDCGYLNYWDVRTDKTFQDYLDSWERCLKFEGSNSVRVPALVRKMFYVAIDSEDQPAGC